MIKQEAYNPRLPCRPNPIVTFNTVWAQGKLWTPKFGDKHTLILLKRNLPKKVSFPRAFCGWKESGAMEESELGQGRAFLRWLQKHDLSIEWNKRDFLPHPYFASKNSPRHDNADEMARGLSFAIRPVNVGQRNIKLYLQDDHMISLLNMPYGDEEDFLELVMSYITQRFEWEKWRAPAPPFLDWVVSHGKRPIFLPGQLGFQVT